MDDDDDDLSEQDLAWNALYDQIIQVLNQFGTEDHFGNADYLLVDDNYGWKRHMIEIHKLHMLNPLLVKKLQALLQKFPDWLIGIAVDLPGTEGRWPPMGLAIRAHEIVDELKRQYLPKEFQDLKFS